MSEGSRQIGQLLERYRMVSPVQEGPVIPSQRNTCLGRCWTYAYRASPKLIGPENKLRKLRGFTKTKRTLRAWLKPRYAP